MAAAKTTPFTCQTPVRHNGKRHAPGETLNLNAAQAEPLLALGAITAAQPTKTAGV